jgi:hypothetical protein
MASEIKVDTISEKTSAGGVTIDGLLIKDGNISGDVALAGTTPTFTIGDAGAEDAALVFDGNAQDYHVGLDDSSDSLVIGLGSALGTTPAMTVNASQVVTFAQNPVFPDGGVAVADLDIDGATDIGAAIVDADLFIIDDGAGGTNRKTTASRLKTYVGGSDPASADGDTLGTASLEWSDLYLADSSVIYFGADQDTTLTHTDGTGLTLNSTNKLTFGDAASFIQQSSDGVLRIDGEATVDINASAAVTIAGSTVPVNVGGIPFYCDFSNNSLYTHDVSGTDSTAANNTAYGIGALDAITTGDYNVAIGTGAGGAIDTGATNVFIGVYAGDGFDAETFNIGVGFDALGGNVAGGEYNTAIGHYAGDAVTSGDFNTLVGFGAGGDMTTGGKNTCVGWNAGKAITTTSYGTHIGYGAGENNTAASTVFVGYYAGNGNTSGVRNIAVGTNAYDTGDTENDNIAVGYEAMTVNNAGGEFNVVMGSYAGNAITSGDDNTLLGYHAGKVITTGYDNTVIGKGAGDAIITGYQNIIIGNNADPSADDNNHSIVIGASITAASNDFAFGKGSNVVSNDFDADANWSRSSDVRKKRNIHSQELGLDFINDLRTVRFQWKPSNEFPKEWNDYSEENNMDLDVIMHGFVAQEVKEALNKHASDGDKEFSGWKENEDGMQNTSREMFVIPLIKSVQELSAQVTTLQDEIKTLKGG